MSQYKNNLGKRIALNEGNIVTEQYAQGGAIGGFAELFDTRVNNEESDQLRNFNIVTDITKWELPDGVEGRALAILGKLGYGIGNAYFEVDFDWKMGTQISVAASFVRIMAAFSEMNAGSPTLVSIGAMLSSGSRAARAQTTRTFPQIIIGTNGEEPDIDNVILFPIPKMAHALNIFANEPEFYEAGTVEIKYVGGASAGYSAASNDLVSWVSDGVPFLQALATEDGVRFPEAARYVQITNLTGGDTPIDLHVTPCFTLSL